MPILLSLLLGCQPTREPASGPAESEPPPCTPVVAVFFDLGETLVTAQDDGKFATIPEAAALLDALEARAVPKGIITNTARGWTRADLAALLVDPGLLDRFEVVLLSSEATANPKPDPAIYAEAIGLMAVPPPASQTLFVTEELSGLADADPPTVGAQAAGLVGVLVESEGAGDTGDTSAPTPPQPTHQITQAELGSLTETGWFQCLENP